MFSITFYILQWQTFFIPRKISNDDPSDNVELNKGDLIGLETSQYPLNTSWAAFYDWIKDQFWPSQPFFIVACELWLSI